MGLYQVLEQTKDTEERHKVIDKFLDSIHIHDILRILPRNVRLLKDKSIPYNEGPIFFQMHVGRGYKYEDVDLRPYYFVLRFYRDKDDRTYVLVVNKDNELGCCPKGNFIVGRGSSI